MKFCVLIALLFVAGCSSACPRSYDVRIEPDMTPDMTQTILDGLAIWEGAAVVHFDIRIAHEECATSLAIPSGRGCIYIAWVDDSQASAMCSSEGQGAAGCTWHADPRGFSSNVLLGDRLSQPWVYHEIVLHEVGHALGLEHTGPGTIMSAGTGGSSRRITQTDVAQYESLRH